MPHMYFDAKYEYAPFYTDSRFFFINLASYKHIIHSVSLNSADMREADRGNRWMDGVVSPFN